MSDESNSMSDSEVALEMAAAHLREAQAAVRDVRSNLPSGAPAMSKEELQKALDLTSAALDCLTRIGSETVSHVS